jgi:hypothetical protein
MKVVVQSSSLTFALLSIILNVPITRVKRGTNGREETGEDDRASGKPTDTPAHLLAGK